MRLNSWGGNKVLVRDLEQGTDTYWMWSARHCNFRILRKATPECKARALWILLSRSRDQCKADNIHRAEGVRQPSRYRTHESFGNFFNQRRERLRPFKKEFSNAEL